jgi:hypothetical protein
MSTTTQKCSVLQGGEEVKSHPDSDPSILDIGIS